VAREGGVARAGERLPLTPHTTSGQPSLVQEYLGVGVFSRIGRSLELTDTGRTVLSYADEISSLDGEREDVIPRLPEGRLQLLRVGTVDVVPGLSPIVFLCLRC
jgi:LysR family transcriptional activator of nhaA